ncbi:hypothetical protein MY11210_008825 [Beauveria gryllotalpidicola]
MSLSDAWNQWRDRLWEREQYRRYEPRLYAAPSFDQDYDYPKRSRYYFVAKPYGGERCRECGIRSGGGREDRAYHSRWSSNGGRRRCQY